MDSFQLLSSSLDSVCKNMSKDDFDYLSLQFDSKVLDLGKKKGFYGYMSKFENFKESFKVNKNSIVF